MKYYKPANKYYFDDYTNRKEGRKYVWAVGPDYSYPLYLDGEVGEALRTSINNEQVFAENAVKCGVWVECDRQGNII